MDPVTWWLVGCVALGLVSVINACVLPTSKVEAYRDPRAFYAKTLGGLALMASPLSPWATAVGFFGCAYAHYRRARLSSRRWRLVPYQELHLIQPENSPRTDV